ncbi:hypothetical protein MMPV_007005 [Pyropia vietnamensis]
MDDDGFIYTIASDEDVAPPGISSDEDEPEPSPVVPAVAGRSRRRRKANAAVPTLREASPPLVGGFVVDSDFPAVRPHTAAAAAVVETELDSDEEATAAVSAAPRQIEDPVAAAVRRLQTPRRAYGPAVPPTAAEVAAAADADAAAAERERAHRQALVEADVVEVIPTVRGRRARAAAAAAEREAAAAGVGGSEGWAEDLQASDSDGGSDGCGEADDQVRGAAATEAEGIPPPVSSDEEGSDKDHVDGDGAGSGPGAPGVASATEAAAALAPVPSLSRAEAKAAKAAARAARRAAKSASKGPSPPPAVTSFADLHLSRPLLRAVEALGWDVPTPIQAAAIPPALAGRDVLGSASTGSGKTAAFMLPVLERLLRSGTIGGSGSSGAGAATRVLALLPTRELAVQCHTVTTALAKYTGITSALAVGGLSSAVQEAALRSRPSVVVATPGRAVDHLRNALGWNLADVEVLVIDEADRLMELGFADETLLFSATLPGTQGVGAGTTRLDALIKASLHKPVRIAIDARSAGDVSGVGDPGAGGTPSRGRVALPPGLTQEVIKVKGASEELRQALLLALASRTYTRRVIVFFAQKKSVHTVHVLFRLVGLASAELHGDMTQAGRLASLAEFASGAADFLLATDVAARGLDVPSVAVVINFDAPRDGTAYVHRVGRTARAGRGGVAVTFLDTDVTRERRLLIALAKSSTATAPPVAARTVPPQVVASWSDRIRSLAPAVEAVAAEEQAQAASRVAARELASAENALIHAAEINARPARSWFQTGKEKAAAKAAALAAAGFAKPEGKGHGGVGGSKTRADRAAAKRVARRREARQAELAQVARDHGAQRSAKRKAAAGGTRRGGPQGKRPRT